MNGKVHYWVACDAVAYIKRHGDDLQKRALQAFQNSYGENAPIEGIPQHRTALEHLAGFESWHTDKFGDLSLRLPVLPWGAKNNITGMGGRMFTAFNHFINPYPGMTHEWETANGYSYNSSSKKGFDSFVVRGISDFLQGMVDVNHSLVLDRIRPYWTKGGAEWKNNFERELVHTTFAPWNVLVSMYYSHLLENHFEPLEVRGPNQYIVGLQLLGPIVHAAADACSPQHVRPALGFGHQVWENCVHSKVYNREIDLNPQLIQEIMTEEPFEPWLTVAEGPSKGRFEVGTFVHGLSVRTVERVRASTERSWGELWQAGDNFWKWYLTGTTMMDDAHYLYNQAVAATIHTIVRAYLDLVNAGILSGTNGLRYPEKMPTLDLVQDDLPDMPMKMENREDTPAEETRPVPFSNARDILGFEPEARADLQALLDQAGNLFARTAPDQRETREAADLMGRMEARLMDEYKAGEGRVGEGFCPLRAVEQIPLDSDISAHHGTSTFRLPSSAECNDPDLLARYIDKLDTHAEMAYKLQLTQAVASLKFYRAKLGEKRASASRIDQVIARMEQERDGAVKRAAAVETRESVAMDRARAAAAKVSLSEKIDSVFRSLLSSVTAAPATALATAAAIVLIVVLLVPRGAQDPTLGLSPVKWATPSMTLMGPEPWSGRELLISRPALAIVIYFQDFEDPVDQSLIDSLYDAVAPDRAVAHRYSVLPPNKMREAVVNGDLKTEKKKEMMQDLRKALNVKKVLAITIVSKGELFQLQGKLTDLETGRTRDLKIEKEFSKAQLRSGLRTSVLDFLGSVTE